MIKVLFVCHGNICRSTMAECVFNDILLRNSEKSISCDSAATSTEEIGNPVHYGTRNVLQRHGIPVGNHRARQMTYQDYKDFDLLIGMDSANIRNMTRIAGGDAENKIKKLLTFCGSSSDVADPWYTGDFDTTYRDVSEGCQALYNWILENLVKFTKN